MKRAIENPYNVSHKIYISLIVIFAIILCTILFVPLGINALVLDIIKNLSYGCIASTVVAWLIDCANIRSANKKANTTYDAVYAELKFRIGAFVGVWSQLCQVCFKDKDYGEHKKTWTEWYETVKLNYYKSDAERQKQILDFFYNELAYYASLVNESLKYIQTQQYVLTINDAMNDNMRSILSDFQFEFHALELDLEHRDSAERFWEHMDAITNDLKNYINNWSDIRYYNSLAFLPYKFLGDRNDIIRAVILSECARKIKKDASNANVE